MSTHMRMPAYMSTHMPTHMSTHMSTHMPTRRYGWLGEVLLAELSAVKAEGATASSNSVVRTLKLMQVYAMHCISTCHSDHALARVLGHVFRHVSRDV